MHMCLSQPRHANVFAYSYTAACLCYACLHDSACMREDAGGLLVDIGKAMAAPDESPNTI